MTVRQMMSRLPVPLLLLAETASAVELPRLLWRASDLMRQPRGHGEPVIVLPGFAADDSSTLILRTYLQLLGYDVCGWALGINRGDVLDDIPRVADLVRRRADESGQRVRMVGWSLGGVIAREVAREDSDIVERVITMGSPVCGGPRLTAARYLYALRRQEFDALEAECEQRNRILLRVPVTAIYASYDGIVAREACFDPHSKVEHVEVGTTHLGLGVSAEVYRIVAQRLAVPTARRRRHAPTIDAETSAPLLQQTG